MKSTKIPKRKKLITTIIIPENRPRVTAISEGVMLGFTLITELTTELTNKDTVAKWKYVNVMYNCLLFILDYAYI